MKLVAEYFLRNFLRMEAALKRLVFFSFLFISVCSSEKGVGESNEREQHVGNVFEVRSILSPTTCSTYIPIKGGSSTPTRNVVYRHGPCSPSWVHEAHAATELLDQFSEESLLEDQLRVNSIHYVLSKNSSNDSIRGRKIELAVKSGISLRTGIGSYIVQVGFGTPTKFITLMLDVGSDLTWIQCDTQFDTSKSTSYSNIPCNTTECLELKSAKKITQSCYDKSKCRYSFKDASKASTGYFAKEKLTLVSDVFLSFKFGCGLINKGQFGRAAGLLGLGRNKLSIVSQTFKKYEGVFSYCLPSTLSATGFLSFGREKGKFAYSTVQFTPLIKNPRNPSFYFIKMTGIIVDDLKLPISASVFQTSGMIIDVGTSISRLPPSAYTALKSAFKKHMEGFRITWPLSILDTCYNLTGVHMFSIPRVTLVFEGNVEVDMGASAVMGGSQAGQLCLAFAANHAARDVGILGNLQQQKLKIVYDIPNNKLGFDQQKVDQQNACN